MLEVRNVACQQGGSLGWEVSLSRLLASVDSSVLCVCLSFTALVSMFQFAAIFCACLILLTQDASSCLLIESPVSPVLAQLGASSF